MHRQQELDLIDYRLTLQLRECHLVAQNHYPGVKPYFAVEWMSPESKKQHLTALLPSPNPLKGDSGSPSPSPRPMTTVPTPGPTPIIQPATTPAVTAKRASPFDPDRVSGERATPSNDLYPNYRLKTFANDLGLPVSGTKADVAQQLLTV